LEERVKEWTLQWKKEGLQEGIQEGMQQGMYQEGNKLLSNQLTHKFGILPTWAIQKIDQANLPTIEQWSLQLLSATKLNDVFH
jgi:flagellar biosynthesis/type III secretory pathway protein FliH